MDRDKQLLETEKKDVGLEHLPSKIVEKNDVKGDMHGYEQEQLHSNWDEFIEKDEEEKKK